MISTRKDGNHFVTTLAIGIAVLLFGLCNGQAQSANDKNEIEKLVQDAGPHQVGVNRINLSARKRSAAVEDWITGNRASIEGTQSRPFDSTSRARSTPKPRAYTTWHAFGGTPDSMQYSAFTQINKTNVSQLEQVWFYPVIGRAELAFSPLIAANVMYVAGKGTRVVVALDAATGKEIWSHPTEGTTNSRGYAYWESKDGSDRRIIFSANDRLQEVDAGTGASIKSFGEDGFVDLRVGLGRDPNSIRRIQSRSPGQVFENLIIQGSLTGEGYEDPPGWLRAYDVLSGKLVWTFHTIPLPGEYGYNTWPPDAYKFTGGTKHLVELLHR